MTTSMSTMAQCQQALINAGYPCGPEGADGLGGKDTQAAIIKFQADKGLAQTGQLDTATMNVLFPTKPSTLETLSMFPTILQMIIGFLPGVPDDIALIEAEIKEIGSTDSGQQKLQSALTFAKAIVAAIEKALGVTPTT